MATTIHDYMLMSRYSTRMEWLNLALLSIILAYAVTLGYIVISAVCGFV